MIGKVRAMEFGGGKTAITWWGHACVELVTPGGVTVLFDPWFANPMSLARRIPLIGATCCW